jgi:hypothetical protein
LIIDFPIAFWPIIYIFAVAQKQTHIMHTILITGGAGFIGSHLTRLFVTNIQRTRL